MKKFIRLFLISVFFITVNINITFADEALLKDTNALKFIDYMVKDYDFSRAQLIEILKEAKFQPSIIQSMNKPYEKKPWDIYQSIFLTEERVKKGLEFWKNNFETLKNAEAKFGVPANIIVAILGVETLYGKRQGDYRVLDALTTLAFYYPRRAEFFTKELKEYLLLCREHKVPATLYLGSYAGAIGKPQFMPSSYRFYAVSANEESTRSDLINEDKDVISSVANYFQKHGWNKNEDVAMPVKVAGTAYKDIDTNNKNVAYDFKQLTAAGIKPIINDSADALHQPDKKVGLIELATQTGEEFWLTYSNFYVITRYNSSSQYALVVYLLSQQLQNQWSLA